jgi:NAD(P)-dependent dehydrogenase (short-subunit alcohol dehydrogenase family)
VSPETTRYADWKKVFAVNVDSVFLGCRAAISSMRRTGGGSIVNIASIAGFMATPYATAYGATKATVRQLTKSIAQHCAEERLNIRCNSVHPGNIRMPEGRSQSMWGRHAQESARVRGLSFEAILAEECARVPLGDLTQPEDVAAAVVFLASDEARQITGEQLIVDGGVIHCNTYRSRA